MRKISKFIIGFFLGQSIPYVLFFMTAIATWLSGDGFLQTLNYFGVFYEWKAINAVATLPSFLLAIFCSQFTGKVTK